MRRLKRHQRSFADLEFERQGVRLDPVLAVIDDVLDRRDRQLLAAVAGDLRRGLKAGATGRAGLTAEQVLRALVLKQIKNWSFRELRERIADGMTLRTFTRFGAASVPQHKAFHRASTRLTPATLRTVNALVVDLALALGVDDARRVRMDTTVSETDIHYPTDSGLLWDAVRVLTRSAQRIVEEVPELPVRLFNRTRAARRRMQEIHRLTRGARQALQEPKYRELIAITEQVLHNVRAVAKAARALAAQCDAEVSWRVAGLCQEITDYAALADRVLAQTRRRILQDETVPADEKLYSIFEPHTDLIKRGKAQKPVEFGHKLFLAESRRGLILDYQILVGNPPDEQHVKPWLARHRERFGTVPQWAAGDRGFYSPANAAALRDGGVVLECLPQRGGQKSAERIAHEKSRRFKQGQRFRAGIEGRISVLSRGRGMKRCRFKGRQRFELFIGLIILANNLLVIGRHLAARRHSRLAA
jgi:IS5 family transposase